LNYKKSSHKQPEIAPSVNPNGNQRNPDEIDPNSIILPNHLPTKCSAKKNGIILAYAANTNQGIIRSLFGLFYFVGSIMRIESQLY